MQIMQDKSPQVIKVVGDNPEHHILLQIADPDECSRTKTIDRGITDKGIIFFLNAN
jgi:hypothetical protein